MYRFSCDALKITHFVHPCEPQHVQRVHNLGRLVGIRCAMTAIATMTEWRSGRRRVSISIVDGLALRGQIQV